MPVNKLLGAKFYGSKNNDSSKVVIDTSNGEVPFISFTSYSDETQQQEIASRISNFVKNRKESFLQVEQNDQWWILIGCISLAIGLYPLLKPKS
ncbi:MAG: hypothetical protein N2235_14980 [Fischerella sp.]|nr:hypothetical protein [Fischerella sp.]